MWEIVGKYYVVFERLKLGIYNTWDEVKLQFLGYLGAQHKMNKDQMEAENPFLKYKNINDTQAHVEITQKKFQ